MLVDINAYIGQWPFTQRRYNTCSARVERMDQFGVDMAVISNLNGIFYKNPQSANEELNEELNSRKIFRDRLIPFAVINPIYASWRDHFKVSTEQMAMKGIRLYPKYHGYELVDPGCIELVKRARDRDLPVAFSLRMVDSRPSSWLDLERNTEWSLKDVMPIVEQVPDAKYLVLNIANSVLLSQRHTDLVKSANVLMDSSGRNMVNLGKLIKTYGSDKFAFGTHAPMLDDVTGLLRIESLRKDEADATTKELLRSGNAKRMLGI